jgi:flagella basal body P-ring formation protein FlgA
MRCCLRLLICAVNLWVLLSSSAFSITYVDLERKIRQELREIYGDKVKLRGMTVYARSLPEGGEWDLRIVVREGDPRGRAFLTFEERGRMRTVTVGLDLLWRCRILVALEDMRAGERAYPWFFEEREVYRPRCPRNLPSNLMDYTLTKDLSRGEVLGRGHLRRTPLVKFGEEVRVTLRRGNLEITLYGKVLDTGFYGDTVRVRVGSAGRVIRARVVGEGAVEVQ